MSAKYDLYETPDIQQTGKKQPLHPRIVPKGTIDQEEFLDRVHQFTGMSRSLLSGALQSFHNELYDLLADGWNVEMGGLGFFSVSLQGPPAMNKSEVRAPSIQLKNINFRASSELKNAVSQKLRLERSAHASTLSPIRLHPEECLKRVYAYLEKYPALMRTDYCKLTGAKKPHALQELNEFVAQGALKRFGTGKQIFYAKGD